LIVRRGSVGSVPIPASLTRKPIEGPLIAGFGSSFHQLVDLGAAPGLRRGRPNDEPFLVLDHVRPDADREVVVRRPTPAAAAVIEEHRREKPSSVPLGERLLESAFLDHVAVCVDIAEERAVTGERAIGRALVDLELEIQPQLFHF